MRADSTQSTESSNTSSQNTESKNTSDTAQKSTTSFQQMQTRQLGKITAYGYYDDPMQRYASSNGDLTKEMIESNPSGNGDITSLMRILPNVQFNNAQNSSNNPGEISPANVSISGGLYYQNNFQIDGLNINNDLDPNGGNTDNVNTLRGGWNQGFAIDTSLLESISVQDSNISAAYGRFTGGVIDAIVRKPRSDGWHANVSYQYTSSNWTKYNIDTDNPLSETFFQNSADEAYQPSFTKHLIRANVEGYITKNLGLIASFSTVRSFIPLSAYTYANATGANLYQGTETESQREQKRISDNYYFKLNYNPTENLTLEAYFGYLPQNNTYFNAQAKDSYYQMKYGGIQSGIKASYESEVGYLVSSLGYTRMENSRRSDKNYYISWYASEDKNWAYGSTNRAIEGGYGDLDTQQNTLTFKNDFIFSEIDTWRLAHAFRIGAELNYADLSRERLENVYFANGLPQDTNGAICNADPLGMGQSFCSNVAGFVGNAQQSWQGQYFSSVNVYQAGSTSFSSFAYGIYVEDDMKLDLSSAGELNIRPGLRFDGDNYMNKQTFAPRFALTYITPAPKEWATSITFGANRYYGRNLFSYRLYDNEQNRLTSYTRSSADAAFVVSTSNNNSTYRFQELNVPYDDELMVGITQKLLDFSATLKYIHRDGKDEIMRRQRSAGSNNLPTIDGYANNYYIWTNDGSSRSDIITFMLTNIVPIETFGVRHQYLLAFDWTQTKRGYNLYSADEVYYNDTDIMYNGQIIKYRDRPVENYTRPYTLRLNTTHTFNIWRTRWLWNNFFRYRAGYERMVLLTRTSAGYDPTFTGSQYGKMRFNGAFTWDMRIGFEVNVWKGNTLYMNLDIYNVLNSRNKTTISSTAAGGYDNGSIASSAAVPVYEIGRQFWLQVGYKY